MQEPFFGIDLAIVLHFSQNKFYEVSKGNLMHLVIDINLNNGWFCLIRKQVTEKEKVLLV